ncbi:S9 family peptidase [Inhella crocodyli]|nr:prolyl oligopeptidase family serine peptidase [Inhella crocodyli]
MNIKLTKRAIALLGMSAVLGATPLTGAWAQTQAVLPDVTTNVPFQPLPVKAYVDYPLYQQGSLSPDGKKLAALAPVGEKRNIVVLDLDTMKPRVVTNFTEYDVVQFNWVGDYLVFSLGTLDTPTGPDFGEGGGLFVVKADGSGGRQLHPTVREAGRQIRVAGRLPNNTEEIIVSGSLRDARAPDLYRLNLSNGKKELLTFKQPGLVTRWLVDESGVPRVATVVDDRELMPEEQQVSVLYRDSADAEWRVIKKFDKGEKERWTPIAMADNNQDFIVSTAKGRDTSALVRFDVAKGDLSDVVAAHPRYDMGLDSMGDLGASLVRDSDGKLVGLSIRDEKLQTVFFNERYAALHAGLERAFPGKAVILQRTKSDRSLVTVVSDRQPATYYLFDEKTRRLKELLRTNESLNERHLAEVRPFLLKTRDGLEIPSYYVLPNSYQPGQKLPTVVHIHGGPFARADTWLGGTGIREAQVLASRGYAVVIPNFRVTPGFGKKIFEAGKKGAYGRQMSEDHEDAAQWAVQQGFADASRMCISGASYGGYASLWAMIKSKPMFKCAVAGLVVSDLQTQLTSMSGDTAYNRQGQRSWKEEILGIKGDDWTKAHEVSPARHGDKFEGALFMYAGRDDIRTPLQQTTMMVDALKRAGKAPEVLMIKDKEGHGYGKLENRVDLYEQMLAFLDKHIGPGSQKK